MGEYSAKDAHVLAPWSPELWNFSEFKEFYQEKLKFERKTKKYTDFLTFVSINCDFLLLNWNILSCLQSTAFNTGAKEQVGVLTNKYM